MITVANGQNLTVVLSEAHTTAAVECSADYFTTVDNAATQPLPRSAVVDTNGTSSVNILAGPSSGTVYIIKRMRFVNMDTVAHTLTISRDSREWSGMLGVGDTLSYESGVGYVVEANYKPIKSFTVHGDAGVNFSMTNATLAERFAGNATRHLFMVDLAGYTQVRLRVNKQVVGTAGSIFRAKYYTSYSATVGNFLQLGASAQVETSMAATGYFDSGWMDLAAGARNDGICIAFTESGGDGVADPAIGATDILFR